MDDMRLDAASNEPARQPEAVAASFIGQSNPPDRPASTHRLVPPPLDQSQQRRRIRLQLLQRLALDAGNNAAHQNLSQNCRLLSIRYKCRMIRLTDEQWERIRDHFPEENIADGRPGRKPTPTRCVLEAVLWILNTGAQWHMLCCRRATRTTKLCIGAFRLGAAMRFYVAC